MRVSYLEGDDDDDIGDGDGDDGKTLVHFDVKIVHTNLEGFELEVEFKTDAQNEWVDLLEDDWAWHDCNMPKKEVLAQAKQAADARSAVLSRARPMARRPHGGGPRSGKLGGGRRRRDARRRLLMVLHPT